MMKSYKCKINLLVCTIIILGFIAIIMLNYINYSKVIKDDIKNISKLTSTNIYSEINNELTKPIFVSLTMANDSFLKDWLNEEDGNDSRHLEKLKNYLEGIEVKYDYNSVFLISNKTSNYYHYKGLHKVINKKDSHDQWYYQFIDKNKEYELDVDNDEADNNTLTVFVNCRIQNENNELMGVTGVGVKMSQVQVLLEEFEKNYALEAFLINENGLIQVHTQDDLIEKENFFVNTDLEKYKGEIVNNKVSLETIRYKENGLDGYVITRYIDELGWYLVVKKDTSVLYKVFMSQVVEEFLILLVVISIVVMIINRIIKKYSIEIIKMTNTDQLTKIPNRRAFDEALNRLFLDDSISKASLFIFDIDDFKAINDTHGHVFGDRVIRIVASYAKEVIGDCNMIARWGGDEFTGILYGPIEDGKVICENIVKKINQDPELRKRNVTISLGLTKVEKLDTVNSLMIRADKGLYKAKCNGKNQVIVI